jgi:hypothetical protein
MQAISVGTSALVTGIITAILSAPLQCADGTQLCGIKTHNILGFQALSQEHAGEMALLLGLLGGVVAAIAIGLHGARTRREA